MQLLRCKIKLQVQSLVNVCKNVVVCTNHLMQKFVNDDKTKSSTCWQYVKTKTFFRNQKEGIANVNHSQMNHFSQCNCRCIK